MHQDNENGWVPEPEVKPAGVPPGLYRKFDVYRKDGKDAPLEKHHGCRYFVLDLDHDPFAPLAMLVYAIACSETHTTLYEDIMKMYPKEEIPTKVRDWIMDTVSPVNYLADSQQAYAKYLNRYNLKD
jgi:hypothetical protein